MNRWITNNRHTLCHVSHACTAIGDLRVWCHIGHTALCLSSWVRVTFQWEGDPTLNIRIPVWWWVHVSWRTQALSVIPNDARPSISTLRRRETCRLDAVQRVLVKNRSNSSLSGRGQGQKFRVVNRLLPSLRKFWFESFITWFVSRTLLSISFRVNLQCHLWVILFQCSRDVAHVSSVRGIRRSAFGFFPCIPGILWESAHVDVIFLTWMGLSRKLSGSWNLITSVRNNFWHVLGDSGSPGKFFFNSSDRFPRRIDQNNVNERNQNGSVGDIFSSSEAESLPRPLLKNICVSIFGDSLSSSSCSW